MKKNLVILLTKFPEIGKVKTRLGKTIGLEKASIIQGLFIKEILNNNYFDKSGLYKTNKNYDFLIGLRGEENIQRFSQYFGVDKKDIFIQSGEDLGAIMNNAIKYGLQDYEQVIIVGSDIPMLNKQDFERGFDILEEKDIVIGKANDGGYYLIGMKKENSILFENIKYSTNTVFDETIKKIKENKFTYGYLVEKIDIDTVEDLLLAEKEYKTGFFKKILGIIK